MTQQTRVAFSGLDGAGKSHQIDALVRDLGDDVEVVWIPFKIWPEQLLKRLPARVRSRLGPARRAVTTSPAAPGRPRPKAGASLRRALRVALWTPVGCAAAVSAGLSLRRRVAAAGSRVVVLDRYRLDTIVKLHYWYAEVPPRLLSWIVLLLAPRPTLEFFLRVPAEDAYARKPEQWSVPQLTRQASAYDSAAVDAGALVLDGREPPDQLATQVLDHVRPLVEEVRHV